VNKCGLYEAFPEIKDTSPVVR